MPGRRQRSTVGRMDVGPVKASPSMPRDPSIGRRFRFSVEKPPNPSNAPQPQSERERENQASYQGVFLANGMQPSGSGMEQILAGCWLLTRNNPLARCLERAEQKGGRKARKWEVVRFGNRRKTRIRGPGALAEHVQGPHIELV